MEPEKQQLPTRAQLEEYLAELETLGILRWTGEYRLSRDGERQRVYTLVPVN